MNRTGLFLLSALLLLVLMHPQAAVTATAVAQPGALQSLLLTEVYYDTPGEDAAEEWVEIANVGTVVLDLGRVAVGDEEKAGGGEGMARFPDGATIAPGQALVVAQTAVGFRRLFGFNPHYEWQESDPNVPNMRRLLLWASGEVALANDGDELLLLAETAVLDAVNYGDSTHFFAPAISDVARGQSIARIPAACDTNTAADWQPQSPPTPGLLPEAAPCPQPMNPARLESLPPIGEIQGTDDVSPYINQIVSVRGVVTGTYEDRNTRGITFYTLFIQDLPGYEDGDPATSDGVAVFLGRQRPSVAIGDQVRVTGQVTEFFGFTELDDDNLQLLVEGSDAPLPEPLPLPPQPTANLEPVEGMRVTLPDTAQVVGPTYSGCGFAVARAPFAGMRLFQREGETAVPLTVLHTGDVDCTGFPDVKVGDQVQGLVGPLIYSFDEFRLVQQDPAGLLIEAAPLPERPSPPTPAADQFAVATFNLENYFDTVDDTGRDEEPKPTAAELALRRQKLADTIVHALGCPALLAVQEVENEPLLTALAAAAETGCGFVYAVAHADSPDARGIDVALLVDPHRAQIEDVQLAQSCTLLTTGVVDATVECPTGEQPLSSRPPLVVNVRLDGAPLRLVVVHLKSKREGEAETTAWRLAQAQVIDEWVASWLQADPAAQIMVLGDFNDTEPSPPLTLLTGSGRLTNVLSTIPDAQRYSFIFGGWAQLLDGVLVSPALQSSVVTATIQHVNADFPYRWQQDAAQSFRAADHDIPLVLFTLPQAPPTVTPLPATAVPTLVRETAVPAPAAPAPAGGSALLWWLGGGGAAALLGILLLLVRRR